MITRTVSKLGYTCIVYKGIGLCRNGGHKLLCSDGIIRGATLSENPNVFFSIPCAVCIGGKRITGYSTTLENRKGEKCYIFRHHTENQKHSHNLPDWPTSRPIGLNDIDLLVSKAYDVKSLVVNSKFKEYAVNVSNIGEVYKEFSLKEGIKVFNEYKYQSKALYGRAAGEDVTLYCDGEPVREYFAPNVIPKYKELANVIKAYKKQLLRQGDILVILFYANKIEWGHVNEMEGLYIGCDFTVIPINKKTKIRETANQIIHELTNLKRI